MIKSLCLLLLSAQVSAIGQGMVYYFSGQVTDISQDAAGSISASGIRVGDTLTASFFVDLSRAGIYTQNDGTIVTPQSDPHDTIQYRYYFDQLLSESPIKSRDGGSNNGPMDVASWNYAYDNFGIAQSFFSMGILQGGNGNEYVTISKSDPMDATIATWKTGDVFDFNGWANDAQNQYSVLKGTVSLASISAVPEPSSFTLICFGLMFLLLRRFRNHGTND